MQMHARSVIGQKSVWAASYWQTIGASIRIWFNFNTWYASGTSSFYKTTTIPASSKKWNISPSAPSFKKLTVKRHFPNVSTCFKKATNWLSTVQGAIRKHLMRSICILKACRLCWSYTLRDSKLLECKCHFYIYITYLKGSAQDEQHD